MEAYHETAAVTSGANPFAYTTVPPIGRLLDLICHYLSVGGCFKPGNRQLADWLGYASASQMPALLSELASKKWITYDRATGLIMLLRDYRTDQAIRSPDRSIEQITDPEYADDSALIDPIDRVSAPSAAEYESDQIDRSIPQCMEDSCLAAAESDSESAAAGYKYHAAQKPISPPDHPAALLLAELGTNATLRARAILARPDLTPQQVRDTWAHFAPRIAAGLINPDAGAFHAAIARGEIHAAPPDPNRPLDPASYAADPAYQLGSDLPPPEVESPRDRALRLLGPWTAENHQAQIRDSMFLQCRLGAGDTDEQALAALAEHRRAVRR
jgi:hypothetical protein